MRFVVGTSNFNQYYGINRTKLKIKDIIKILKFSKKKKVNFIDTALDYNLSKNFFKYISFKDFKIITKIKLPKKDKIKFIDNLELILLDEIKKFKNKNIYALLLHRSKDLDSIHAKKLLKKILFLKNKKLINKIGVSVYEIEELDKILKLKIFDIIQVPINVFDQRFASKKVLKKIKNQGIEIQARSVFLQGKLLKKPKKKDFYINKFFEFCNNNSINPLIACLSFIKNIDEINYITVGIDNKFNLEKILASWKQTKKLNFDELSVINKKIIDPRKW